MENVIVRQHQKDTVVEMVKLCCEEGWVAETIDGYNWKFNKPVGEGRAKQYKHLHLIEVLFTVVAPMLGMTTVTIDLSDVSSIVALFINRYEAFLNTEVGELRT